MTAELEKVEAALKGLQNEKRDVSSTAGSVVHEAGDLVDGVVPVKREDAISGLAGQLLPSLTKQGILPEVTDLKQLTGLLNVLNANSLLSNVEQVLGGLVSGLPLVGDLLKRDDAISGLAGQLLPSLTKQGILPEVTNLTQLTNLLNVLNANSLLSNVEQVLGGLLNNLPLKGLPLVGDLLKREEGGLLGGLTEGILKRDDAISGLAGQLLPSLTKQGILPEVTDLKQLTGLLNVLNANSLLSNVEQVLGGLVSGLPLVGDLLKRDDAISGLAGQLLPSLTKQGILPEVTNLTQLTNLLNVLNANSLLSNVEQVLGGLLNNLPLKGLPLVGDLLGGLKRDDPISSLAGQLLPSLTKQGILPQVTDLKQLTGLLNVLNVNGLLGNVEQLLGGLLNGLPLKGL